MHLDKKYILKILFAFVFILYFLLFSPKSIDAQTVPLQSLRVTPIINDLHITPGQSTTFPLTIQNLSNAPLGIHAEISGYDQIGEVPLYQQKPSEIINWTHLSKTDILLEPKSTKTIIVTITPPSHLPPSGYYETIFLAPIVNQDNTPGSPSILSRVGALVLGTVGTLNYDNLVNKISVSDFSPSNTIVNTFPTTISFAINNNYFTHFDAKPFLTITPLFGNPQTTLIEDKHVLPGSSRIWQYQPSDVPLNIFYQLHLAVSIGDGKQMTADTWIIVLPYKLLLIFIAVIAVFYLVTSGKKRLKKFFTILLRG